MINLKTFIDELGGQTAAAKALGVTQGMVYQWINDIKPVSPAKAVDIERLSHGRLRAEDLCPSVDWSVIRGNSEAA